MWGCAMPITLAGKINIPCWRVLCAHDAAPLGQIHRACTLIFRLPQYKSMVTKKTSKPLMRRFVILILLFTAMLSSALWFRSSEPVVLLSDHPPKVIDTRMVREYQQALVLGSGGPRGFAHIGVLQVLEEAGYKPDLIVGTSMGAIIGAALSAGRSAHEMERLAREYKPKLILAGASAYALRIDFERFAKVAKEIGAIFMVDMAHYAGLIAAGVYPSPIPHADVVTSTTHKSLRGPRGGIILMKPELEKAINSAIFPGIQGGPLMHVIAAKAVAFKEALDPSFKIYQQQVLKNADAMAKTLIKRGLRIVSGRTESHVMLVDLRAKNITGKAAEALLGLAHITVNKNAIPNDPEKPFVTSGIRLGSPAMTTRGFKEAEAELTANLIADLLDKPTDDANTAAVRAKVEALTARFPVYAA